MHTKSTCRLWVLCPWALRLEADSNTHGYSTSINGSASATGLEPSALGLAGLPGLGEQLGWYNGEELGELSTGPGLLGAGAAWRLWMLVLRIFLLGESSENFRELVGNANFQVSGDMAPKKMSLGTPTEAITRNVPKLPVTFCEDLGREKHTDTKITN